MPDREKHDRKSPREQDDTSVRGWRRLARVLLVVYVAALVGLAYWCSLDASLWNSISWRPQDAIWIVQVVGQIGADVAKGFLMFVSLGFLAGAACAPGERDATLFAVLSGTFLAFVLSLTIALGVRTPMSGTPIVAPTFSTVFLLALACSWGSWLGATWMGARNTLGWLFKQAFSAAFFVCGAATVLTWFALSAEPLDITTTSVSTDDRRHLVKILREHDPRDLQVDEATELRITEQELNQLTSWGLTNHTPEGWR